MHPGGGVVTWIWASGVWVLPLTPPATHQGHLPRVPRFLPSHHPMLLIETTFQVSVCSYSHCAVCLVAQSCLTLYDPLDCSPPGSSVHGILQARILEWVAMLSSRASSQPGIKPVSYIPCVGWQVGSLLLAPSGKPLLLSILSN